MKNNKNKNSKRELMFMSTFVKIGQNESNKYFDNNRMFHL